jgi:hypothetical protein
MQILKNALLPPPKEGNKPAISLTMVRIPTQRDR